MRLSLLILLTGCGLFLTAQRTYLIDFGPADNPTTGTSAYWNNATDPTEAAVILPLRSTDDVASDLFVSVERTAVNGGNDGSAPTMTTDLDELGTATATADYFRTSNRSELVFSGLDPAAAYAFTCFGSGSHTGNRRTTYTLTGSNGGSGQLATSGPGLGGEGVNFNVDETYRSVRVFPTAAGTITLEFAVTLGQFGYLNALRLEEFPDGELCGEQDRYGIAVMGSSVARGQGAPADMGYAFMLQQLLDERNDAERGGPWEITNISVGGNNTVAVANRYDADLLPLCDRYVVFGLSLANEGIRNGGQPVFDQFRDNLRALVDRARADGKEPVVVSNYARRDYDAGDYAFIRQMNLLIHQWDVASVNVLGANDNGSGNWVPGFSADLGHPNEPGHREFFYSFVPSLFDALDAGKPVPTRNEDFPPPGVEAGSSVDPNPIVFWPEETAHSFTFTVDIDPTGSGRLLDLMLADSSHREIRIAEDGTLTYGTPGAPPLLAADNLNDGWTSLSLSHNYARQVTTVFLDGTPVPVRVDERLVPARFVLAGAEGPTDLRLRNLFFHRSSMNADEIEALHNGALLNSSLELFYPLEEMVVDNLSSIGPNLAQSLNAIFNDRLNSVTRPVAELGLSVFPNPASDRLTVRAADGRPVGHVTLVSAAGRVVRQGVYRGPLDVGGLPPGVYVLLVQRADGSRGRQRVVVW